MLSTECILSLPDFELNANLDLMAENNIELPTEVLSCLVSINASSHLAAAEHSIDRLNRLIATVKPWSDGSEVEFNHTLRSTWMLGHIKGLNEEEKNTWFLDTCIHGFVLKNIASGKDKSALVKSSCDCLVRDWEADTAHAMIGDTTADMMDACLKACRVCSAVIGLDVATLTEEMWGDIEWIGKLRGQAADGIDCAMAVSMGDDEWYNGRLSKLVSIKGAVMKHSELLNSDDKLWANLNMEYNAAKVEELLSMTSHLCLFCSELPPEMIKPLLDRAEVKLNRIISHAVSLPPAKVNSSDLGALQKVVCEATLVFSLDSELDELSHKVAAAMKMAATVSI